MSAISYKQRDAAAGVLTGPTARRAWLSSGLTTDCLLAAFMLAMLVLMIRMPGEETIPYHFLFLSLTIVYGFRVWPLWPTLLVALGAGLLVGVERERRSTDDKTPAGPVCAPSPSPPCWAHWWR